MISRGDIYREQFTVLLRTASLSTLQISLDAVSVSRVLRVDKANMKEKNSGSDFITTVFWLFWGKNRNFPVNFVIKTKITKKFLFQPLHIQ